MKRCHFCGKARRKAHEVLLFEYPPVFRACCLSCFRELDAAVRVRIYRVGTE